MELQVEARNLEIRKVWQDKIDEEKTRLERHHAGFIHHLRVTVEGTYSHREGGYEVRLVASIPNDTVVVKRKGEKVVPLLVDAFNTLGLQLKELQRKRRQSYKVQPEVTTSAGGEGELGSVDGKINSRALSKNYMTIVINQAGYLRFYLKRKRTEDVTDEQKYRER